jgi:nucleoside 2-deoxyribosyltransferase-like protein
MASSQDNQESCRSENGLANSCCSFNTIEDDQWTVVRSVDTEGLSRVSSKTLESESQEGLESKTVAIVGYAPLPWIPVKQVSLCLAGGNPGLSWRSYMIERLSCVPITVFDVYHSEYTGSKPSFEDGSVLWELRRLQEAKVIALYVEHGWAASPVALMELGLYAQSGKLVVYCPSAFAESKGVEDIMDVCALYDVLVVDSLDKLVDAVKEKVLAVTA